MAKLRELLKQKGTEVWTIEADKSVLDAIQRMAEADIGALVVTENGNPVGVFTERHYTREVFLKGRQSPTTPIREVMSTHVVCASPEQSIENCISLMANKHVRHLPVIDDGKLVGIVSIGDLIRSQVHDKESTIEHLFHYIHGPMYPPVA